MSIFIDTSAIFAWYDDGDTHHALAASLWRHVVQNEWDLVTTNYVLLESHALVQRRLGMALARRLEIEARPLLRVIWVDEEMHDRGAAVALTSGRRSLSLVDCVSFEVMRRHAISHALSFDQHFAEWGYPLPELPRG